MFEALFLDLLENLSIILLDLNNSKLQLSQQSDFSISDLFYYIDSKNKGSLDHQDMKEFLETWDPLVTDWEIQNLIEILSKSETSNITLEAFTIYFASYYDLSKDLTLSCVFPAKNNTYREEDNSNLPCCSHDCKGIEGAKLNNNNNVLKNPYETMKSVYYSQQLTGEYCESCVFMRECFPSNNNSEPRRVRIPSKKIRKLCATLFYQEIESIKDIEHLKIKYHKRNGVDSISLYRSLSASPNGIEKSHLEQKLNIFNWARKNSVINAQEVVNLIYQRYGGTDLHNSNNFLSFQDFLSIIIPKSDFIHPASDIVAEQSSYLVLCDTTTPAFRGSTHNPYYCHDSINSINNQNAAVSQNSILSHNGSNTSSTAHSVSTRTKDIYVHTRSTGREYNSQRKSTLNHKTLTSNIRANSYQVGGRNSNPYITVSYQAQHARSSSVLVNKPNHYYNARNGKFTGASKLFEAPIKNNYCTANAILNIDNNVTEVGNSKNYHHITHIDDNFSGDNVEDNTNVPKIICNNGNEAHKNAAPSRYNSIYSKCDISNKRDAFLQNNCLKNNCFTYSPCPSKLIESYPVTHTPLSSNTLYTDCIPSLRIRDTSNKAFVKKDSSDCKAEPCVLTPVSSSRKDSIPLVHQGHLNTSVMEKCDHYREEKERRMENRKVNRDIVFTRVDSRPYKYLLRKSSTETEKQGKKYMPKHNLSSKPKENKPSDFLSPLNNQLQHNYTHNISETRHETFPDSPNYLCQIAQTLSQPHTDEKSHIGQSGVSLGHPFRLLDQHLNSLSPKKAHSPPKKKDLNTSFHNCESAKIHSQDTERKKQTNTSSLGESNSIDASCHGRCCDWISPKQRSRIGEKSVQTLETRDTSLYEGEKKYTLRGSAGNTQGLTTDIIATLINPITDYEFSSSNGTISSKNAASLPESSASNHLIFQDYSVQNYFSPETDKVDIQVNSLQEDIRLTEKLSASRYISINKATPACDIISPSKKLNIIPKKESDCHTVKQSSHSFRDDISYADRLPQLSSPYDYTRMINGRVVSSDIPSLLLASERTRMESSLSNNTFLLSARKDSAPTIRKEYPCDKHQGNMHSILCMNRLKPSKKILTSDAQRLTRGHTLCEKSNDIQEPRFVDQMALSIIGVKDDIKSSADSTIEYSCKGYIPTLNASMMPHKKSEKKNNITEILHLATQLPNLC